MPEEHRYKVAYAIKPLGKGLTKQELIDDPAFEDYGGTDELINVSRILPEGGGASIRWNSTDGDGNSLPDEQVIEVMGMMARSIAMRGTVSPAAVEHCWKIWNAHLKPQGLQPQELDHVRETFRPRGTIQ